MRPVSRFLFPAAAAVLLGVGLDARADLVHWSYNWSRDPIVVAAGTGGITLTDEPLNQAAGSSDIVATNLKVFSSADDKAPDTLSGNPYKLSLTLTDAASKATATLDFSGKFFGTFSANSSNVTTTFTGPTKDVVKLGNNTYTVTFGPYSPPGPPSATNAGSIAAHVDVQPGSSSQGGGTGGHGTGGGHNPTPEPSSVVLAGLGVAFLGLVSWRRYRCQQAMAVEVA